MAGGARGVAHHAPAGCLALAWLGARASLPRHAAIAGAERPATGAHLHQLQLHHHHLLLHLHLHLLHRLHLSAHVLRQAEAHAREELGATTALLLEQVAMHEVLLEAMYDVHIVAMYDVSRLSPQQVGRHQHCHGTTTAPPRRPPPPPPPPARRLQTRLASRP